MARVSVRLLACALAAALAAACASGPVPPDPASLSAVDRDVVKLVDELTAAVNADRGDGARWGRLAMAYEANGLLPQAASLYDTAVELDATEPRWRYRRALLSARNGDIDRALADLDRVIELAPGYSPARWRQGLWRLDRGEFDAASASFRDAVAAGPADPGGPIGLALVHLAARQDAAAAAELERLLEKSPGERYALHLLGTAYQRMGRAEDARFALRVGRAGQPSWLDPWSDEVTQYRRGYAVLLKEATQLGLERRYDDAIAVLERLRTVRPDDMALRVYLGGMYATAGRLPQAVALLEPVLAADASNFDATLHLASGYLFAGELGRAADYATRALALRPSSADAAKLQGIVSWQQGREKDAIEKLTRAADGDPRDAVPLLWIGMIDGQHGRYLEARKQFESALDRDPMLGDALIGLADTYAATGDFDQARAILARAEQAEPGNPRLAAARVRIGGAPGAKP